MNRRLVRAITMVVLCIGSLFVVANILQRTGVSLIYLTGGIGLVLIGAWIYMVWMVWRKKTKISHDRIEPKRAERRYQIMKGALLASGVLLLAGIIGTVGHNAIYAMKEIEESVFFFIAIVGLFGFVITTTGGWIYYFTGRKAT